MGGSLWLDKEYPIHVDDIHHLTGLSARENAMNVAFQVGTKRAKKQGENDYYAKYGMKHGGRGAKVDLIRKNEIRFACYIIAGKTMIYFARNECTLEAILVVEHCCNGEVLN